MKTHTLYFRSHISLAIAIEFLTFSFNSARYTGFGNPCSIPHVLNHLGTKATPILYTGYQAASIVQ
jgi:hypothetical protein